MKRIITIFLVFFTQVSLLAQEGLSTAEKVDGVFKNMTGWFVEDVIFKEINFGKVNETRNFNLSDSLSKDFTFKIVKDSIYISSLKLKSKQTAEEIHYSNPKARILENSVIVLPLNQIQEFKNESISISAPFVKVPWVLFVLIGGAIYFTFTFRFVQFRLFGTAIKTVQGKYDKIDHHGAHKTVGDDVQNDDIPDTIKVEGHHGEVSHFQALSAALSGTVGLGNIAGVAVALSIGGPGATFWMIVAGLLGMASKFAECTLGVCYRDIDENGVVYGGPMYYLTKGLKEKGLKNFGKVLAVIFAVLVIGGSFGGGNMFQANQASAQLIKLFEFSDPNAGIYIGIVMALLTGLVIIGGIKRIASVTDKLVPFMAVMYVGAALVIIMMNYQYIPQAVGLIFTEAFTGTAIAGGFIGALIQGFKRGTFSNEAGVGSAAIAHSAVRTRYPASEGVVALLEPFIDTVVICTITAIVLIVSNLHLGYFQYGEATKQGVELTATAFDAHIPHSSIALTIAVFLFAFSTMISWSYYGLQGFKFLFGKSKVVDITYKLLFLIFVVIGAAISLGSVIDFSDAMIFGMVVPNMIGVVLLIPTIRKELAKYLKAIAAVKK